jgi:hypothetical protein
MLFSAIGHTWTWDVNQVMYLVKWWMFSLEINVAIDEFERRLDECRCDGMWYLSVYSGVELR